MPQIIEVASRQQEMRRDEFTTVK